MKRLKNVVKGDDDTTRLVKSVKQYASSHADVIMWPVISTDPEYVLTSLTC
jgi:hypothetical protein